ncbi:MAG: FUN14 domain-containing protein [Thermofilaceae archaeon]
MDATTLAGTGATVLIGYALGKAAKIVVTVIGVFLLALILLERGGYIAVNWSRVVDALNGLMEQLKTLAPEALAKIGLPLAGLSVGLYLGLKH